MTTDTLKISEAYLNKVRDPRLLIPKVRGGWTKDKIKRYIQPSSHGVWRAIEFISEYDSPEDLKNHMFYHGSSFGTSGGMKPSIKQRKEWAEQYGGGGYGERYWGISVTPDKTIASNFAHPLANHVGIYPVLLAKGAKVEELPKMSDAIEVEDIIEELWNRGVDAVKLGPSSEKELLVLNPTAMCNIGAPDFYNLFGLTKDKIRKPTDEDIRKMWEFAKRYMEMREWRKANPRPEQPKPTVRSYVGSDGREHYYRNLKTKPYVQTISKDEYDHSMEEYGSETAKGKEEMERRQKEYDERPEAKEYMRMKDMARNVIRF